MERDGICVSLGARSIEELGSKVERALALGADLIEIRVDFLGEFDSQELRDLLKERLQRCILTCRVEKEGGLFRGSEEQRLQIIDRLIHLQPAYVDIELETLMKHGDLTRKALSKGVSIIASWHDHKQTPPTESLLVKVQRARGVGDIAKIVTTATSLGDNVTILELYRSTEKDGIIAFCMGDVGTISRILCLQLGSPFTYASLPKEPLAPGQISIDDLRRLYRILEDED